MNSAQQQTLQIERAAKDARAWGTLPNRVAIASALPAAALVLLSYRVTFAGQWALNPRDVQRRFKRGLGRRVYLVAIGYLKPAGVGNPHGQGLLRRDIARIAGRQGPGRVRNDALTFDPRGKPYRRVERRWFNGDQSMKAIATLLYVRAMGKALPWQIAKRFGWSLPTVNRACADLCTAGLLMNDGFKQQPLYKPTNSKNAHSKNERSIKGSSKKALFLRNDLPLRTVDPEPSVVPALSSHLTPLRIDGAKTQQSTPPEDRVPLDEPSFSADVIVELSSLGLDVEELVQVYQERTHGKGIRKPSAYLLAMGRNEIAARTGVTVEQLKAATSRNPAARVAATVAMGGFRPTEDRLHRARRTHGDLADKVAAALASKTFVSQKAADSAFEGMLANAVLRLRDEAAGLRGTTKIGRRAKRD